MSTFAAKLILYDPLEMAFEYEALELRQQMRNVALALCLMALESQHG